MKSAATKIQMYLAALRIVFSTARNSFGVIVLEDLGAHRGIPTRRRAQKSARASYRPLTAKVKRARHFCCHLD